MSAKCVRKQRIAMSSRLGLLSLLIISVGAAWQDRQDRLDDREAMERLRTIGRALQLYREAYPPKPVSERRTFADAGLPRYLTTLCEKDRPYTIPFETFFLTQPRTSPPKMGSFSLMYWPESSYRKLGDISDFYASRGEKLPVLVDFNRMSAEDFASHEPGRVLVLRLNGEVEWITYDQRVRLDIFRR